MNKNNITIAPSVSGVLDLYEIWKETNFGTEDMFYEFLTTPSIERTEFLKEQSVDNSFIDNFFCEIYSV